MFCICVHPCVSVVKTNLISSLFPLLANLIRSRRIDGGPVVLDRKRIYILPTRRGLLFAVFLLVMLLGSINYALSLGFVLTFLPKLGLER